MNASRTPPVLVAIFPFAAMGLTWVELFRGTFANAASAWPMVALSLLGAALLLRILERANLGARATRTRRLRLCIELALLSLAVCEVAIQATGGARSPLSPLLFVFVGGLFLFLPTNATLWLSAIAAAGDALLLAARGDLFGPEGARPAFVLVFGALAFVAVRLRGTGAPTPRAVSTSAAGASGAPAPALSTNARSNDHAAAAHNANDQISRLLELVHCALRPHTVALFWLAPDGKTLAARASITRTDAMSSRALRAGEGALGGILKGGSPVNLANLRDASRLPYYSKVLPIRAFLGVPVVLCERIAGVLIVDRLEDRAFDAADELLLGHAAKEISRAIESERLFTNVAEAKATQERFHRASESFREALSFDDVFRAAANAAYEVVPWDFAAVTRLDPNDAEAPHRVACVFGDGDARLVGRAVHESLSLCAMVVKNRHELPLYGEPPGGDVAVFSPRDRLCGYGSLLTLPLVARGEVQGTLVLGARRNGAFTVEAREMLRILANQAAGSLEHAAAYARLEMLATTDGLTGLINHRHFQERIADRCARSDRLGQKMCLILCDVDHFKHINDSYGHPVGDTVLRDVASVLADSVRQIDVVARYGGEEFALVLEGTDGPGGMQLAERIRGEIATRVFRCSEGSFRVTMSFGVAEYPHDADDKHALIDVADQALYAAKHGGRNRTMRAEPTRRVARA
jgi:diguanylate cyclase (GGDEF)-like protein